MREYKFRAKNSHSDEWVYGNLVNYGFEVEIQGFNPYRRDIVKEDEEWDEILVDPETIGQFTGLLDENGKEIYEGDIIEGEMSFWIKEYEHVETFTSAVFFREGTFVIESDIYANIPIIELNNIQIIGNITDNHELIKKEE